jgi:hypothetical protein
LIKGWAEMNSSMKDINKENSSLPKKRSAFGNFTEIVGWIQIAASPFLIGLIIGAVIYFLNPKRSTMIVGISISAIGLGIGAIWATRVWKHTGTIHFMSRIVSTPELDKKNEDPS